MARYLNVVASSGGGRDLDAKRARRWWRNRPPIRTIQRAAGFIDDLGFALLFPAKGVALPSLYEAATDLPPGDIEWGPDPERVWGWKDELPRLGHSGGPPRRLWTLSGGYP
jgi:hypothetical protein